MVISVITLVGLTALPNVVNQSDRAELDRAAQKIRLMLLDAHTRSLAPRAGDVNTWVYEVTFGNFTDSSTVATDHIVKGNDNTQNIQLLSNTGACDAFTTLGGTTIETYKLPRNVFISKFFPSNQDFSAAASAQLKNPVAAVMYQVGQPGFRCGSLGNVAYSSTDFVTGTGWTSGSGQSRYLWAELSTRKVTEHRYVVVDRLTSDVQISKQLPDLTYSP